MPFIRKRNDLKITEAEKERLENLIKSRIEAHSKVVRANILWCYARREAIHAIARKLGVSRPLVERCVDKALAGGIEVALTDLRRKGRPPIITVEDKTWVINLACKKPKDLGYSYERWTISLLAKHVKKNAVEEGHSSLSNAGKSLIHGILKEMPIRPHKTKSYLKRRDPEFEQKMAQVLMVYKEVQIVNEGDKSEEGERLWSVISYDEKPGIQAIESAAPDLPPVPGKYPAMARDSEYRRHGTVSLLAGIDLHNGHVTGIVRDRHRSREFIEFLSVLDQEYPAKWKLRIILDNHSAHISKETIQWLKKYPNRFEFIHTPKHGSWLNLIEIFFSKMARSFLRFIRVKSKEDLKERIEKYLNEINEEPVVFRWKYKMDEVLV
jgi:transposase